MSHVDYGRVVDRCDVLANCLAVILDVASADRARKVAEHLLQVSRDSPFPARSWSRPDNGASDGPGLWKSEVDQFQGKRWRNDPFRYHNAGVWPFIGGFLVSTLSKLGFVTDADVELGRLACANEVGSQGRWGFHEWLDGETGTPEGTARQAWSAGSYCLAFHDFALAAPGRKGTETSQFASTLEPKSAGNWEGV